LSDIPTTKYHLTAAAHGSQLPSSYSTSEEPSAGILQQQTMKKELGKKSLRDFGKALQS
jgi:hypothetical protein